MKYSLHIPTEQFGFVAIEIEKEGEVSPQELKDAYSGIKRAWDGAEGIPDKDMNAVVDKMLLGATVEGGIELYENMNDIQKITVQCIKRSLKRLEAREGKKE